MANKKQIEEAMSFINARAKESITVSDSVVSLTAGVYGTNTRALIQCQDNNIRFWITGDDPATDSGIIITPGTLVELHGTTELSNFKAIRDDSSDAVLAVQYYR